MIDDSQLVQQLLENGLIDQAKLREGMKLRKENDTSLYETLVLNDFVEESKIVRVVSKLMNVPFVDLGRVDLEPKVTSLVPSSMAIRNSIIPIQLRKEGGESQLILGMVDPIDVMAMDEVATHTGVDIRPVLVGPAEMRDAIARAYAFEKDASTDMTDDLLDGLDDLAADVLSDENWADFFDSAEEIESTEESSVISADMKDRPTTDVFNAVDEVPSLDELELEDLNEPIDEVHTSSSLSDLEDWDVDDAITNFDDDTTSRRAEILSADDAESIFDEGEPTGQRASIASEVEEEPEEEYLDEPTQKKTVEELEAEMADDQESTDSATAVGLGLDESSSTDKAGAAYQTKDDDTSALADEALDSNTGRTQAGMGARALADAVSGDKKAKETGTDWGALGRQILKGDEEEEAQEAQEADPETEAEALGDDTANQEPTRAETSLSEDSALGDPDPEDTNNVSEESADEGTDLSQGSEPATREIAENDLRALTGNPDERSRQETSEYESVDLDNTGKTEIGVALQPRETPQAGVSTANEFARDETTRSAVDSLEDDPDQTQNRNRSVVELAARLNDWDLPSGVNERHLLLALVNLLVSQGVITRDEVVALAAALSEAEK